MGLQTGQLVMAALSVNNDQPANSLQKKPLTNGIHLRWAFEQSRGFPWYGYYLFRRPHSSGDLERKHVNITGVGIVSGATSAASDGATWSSDSSLWRVDFPPGSTTSSGFDLSGRNYLRLSLPTRASEVTVDIGFIQEASCRITAFLQQTVVGTMIVKGQPGDINTATVAADAISSVEFGPASAVLLKLDFLPVVTGSLQGWQAVPNFTYPLCLPVADPAYPCAGAPTTFAAAQQLALDRILYQTNIQWSGANFRALHEELVKLVRGGMAAGRMSSRVTENVPSSSTSDPPNMSQQYPLDLILLASLNPAVAQMVGLYWLDTTAAQHVAYDYLIVSALGTDLGNNAASALRWLNNNGFDEVDAYIAFNKSLDEIAPPSDPPSGLKIFALPNLAIFSESDAAPPVTTNHAGLYWSEAKSTAENILPNGSIAYHVWRAALGNGDNPSAVTSYDPLTENSPVVIVKPLGASTSEPGKFSTWPPDTLFYIDSSLSDAWYGYQLSGVDIFGRHSRNSEAGSWYQWTPPPIPKPWYFRDPPAPDLVVHPSAVRLRDTTPPPAPTGVEAFALDPQDPYIVKDAAYNSWWNRLTAAAWYQALDDKQRKNLIGLRVRWRWTASQMWQAPDVREFRIYYYDKPMNVLHGKVLEVVATSGKESTVSTDIPNTYPAGAYNDLWLSIGNDGFKIIHSEAAGSLKLRVKNIGTNDDRRPPSDVPCLIVIPPDRPPLSYVDYGVAKNWQQRYYVVDYNDSARWKPEPATTDHAGRIYEVFLPDPNGAIKVGLSLETTLEEPIRYAWIGVSAADDKTYQLDTIAGGTWGNRYGNEGLVGGPATIFRVRREPPPAPQLPPADSDKVYATPADYHNQSFYTFRWIPDKDANGNVLPIGCHVFRALDDSLFNADWDRPLEARLTLDANSNSEHRKLFPLQSSEPRWDAQKCQQVATELNALNTLKQSGTDRATALERYATLSNDALRVLAGLPGNERAFTQLTTKPLDPAEPQIADHRGPDSPDNYAANPDLRAYVDTLDGRSINRYFYRAGSVDGAHNRSVSLSLSTPPVCCPDVVPPRAPVITKVLGGDRRINIKWASNREPDLLEYRVYRADSADAARDLRLMKLVGTVAADPDPTARPAEVAWTDYPLRGLVDRWYRIVAVDRSDPVDPRGGGGNVSVPSTIVTGRAFKKTLPAAPVWTSVVRAANEVQLRWSTEEPWVVCAVQRRSDGGVWRQVSSAIPAPDTAPYDFHWEDPVDAGRSYEYRVLVNDEAGVRYISDDTRTA